jgi:hydrogenase expression/formation protein HypC
MCLGIPGKIVELRTTSEHLAVADVGGVRREINIGLVADDDGGLSVGEWVLIHVGFAMAVVDEDEAHRTIEFLRELGSLYDEEIDQLREGETL